VGGMRAAAAGATTVVPANRVRGVPARREETASRWSELSEADLSAVPAPVLRPASAGRVAIRQGLALRPGTFSSPNEAGVRHWTSKRAGHISTAVDNLRKRPRGSPAAADLHNPGPVGAAHVRPGAVMYLAPDVERRATEGESFSTPPTPTTRGLLAAIPPDDRGDRRGHAAPTAYSGDRRGPMRIPGTGGPGLPHPLPDGGKRRASRGDPVPGPAASLRLGGRLRRAPLGFPWARPAPWLARRPWAWARGGAEASRAATSLFSVVGRRELGPGRRRKAERRTSPMLTAEPGGPESGPTVGSCRRIGGYTPRRLVVLQFRGLDPEAGRFRAPRGGRPPGARPRGARLVDIAEAVGVHVSTVSPGRHQGTRPVSRFQARGLPRKTPQHGATAGGYRPKRGWQGLLFVFFF